METTDAVELALQREIAAGRMTDAEAAELHERLACLAFNMTAAGKSGQVPERASAYWLFHLRRRKPALLPAASDDELARALPIWRRGEAAGFVRVDAGAMAFASAEWQVALCLAFVRDRPLTLDRFRLMARPSFREVWRAWAELRPSVREEVAALLRTSPSRRVRYRAATVLSWIAAPELVEPLIAALDDTSGGVRLAAAQALAAIGDPRAIAPIMQHVQDPEGPADTALARTLRPFGEHALWPLLALTEGKHAPEPRWAMELIGRLGDQRAVGLLLSLLDQASELGHRRLVIAILGELRATAAVPVLIEALALPDLRLDVAHALKNIGDPTAIGPLLAFLANPAPASAYTPVAQDKQSQEWWAAAVHRATGSALVALASGDAYGVFLRAWRGGAPQVRPYALAALAKIGLPGTRELLLTALHDQQADVRAAAVQALGELGDAEDVEHLAQALDDTDHGVRTKAEWTLSHLARVGDDSAANALILALQNTNASVRVAAAFTLRTLGDKRAAEPLISALTEAGADQVAIVETLSILGALADARLAETLIHLVLEPPPSQGRFPFYVDASPIRALAELGDVRAVEPLIRLLAEAPPVVADAPSPEAHVLRAGLQAAYWSRRREVIAALGKFADERAVEPLIAILGDGEGGPDRSQERSTSVAAAEALGQLGDPRALFALERVQRPREPSDSIGRALNRAAAQSIRRIRERRQNQ